MPGRKVASSSTAGVQARPMESRNARMRSSNAFLSIRQPLPCRPVAASLLANRAASKRPEGPTYALPNETRSAGGFGATPEHQRLQPAVRIDIGELRRIFQAPLETQLRCLVRHAGDEEVRADIRIVHAGQHAALLAEQL